MKRLAELPCLCLSLVLAAGCQERPAPQAQKPQGKEPARSDAAARGARTPQETILRLQNENADLAERVEDLQADLDAARQKLKEAQEQAQKARKEAQEQAQKAREEAGTAAADLQTQTAKLAAENAELKKSSQKAQSDLEDLQKQLKETKETADRQTLLSQQLADARKMIDDAVVNYRRCDEERRRKQDMLERLEKVAAVLRLELVKREERIAGLEEKLAAQAPPRGQPPAAPTRPAAATRPAAKPATKPAGRISGEIVRVKADMASANIGSAVGVERGMKLAIHRGTQLIGYLNVAEVSLTESAGFVVDKKAQPKAGDKVTLTLK